MCQSNKMLPTAEEGGGNLLLLFPCSLFIALFVEVVNGDPASLRLLAGFGLFRNFWCERLVPRLTSPDGRCMDSAESDAISRRKISFLSPPSLALVLVGLLAFSAWPRVPKCACGDLLFL